MKTEDGSTRPYKLNIDGAHIWQIHDRGIDNASTVLKYV